MALTFTSAFPRRLVAVQARAANSDSWVDIPGVELIAWRPQVITCYDYIRVNTTSNMDFYRASGHGRGYGRRYSGVLWMRDSEAMEALVAYSHMNSCFAATIDPLTNLQLQWKFNTGINTNNYRYCTKLCKPVMFGSGYGMQDWISTLRGADKGLRGLFPLPWRVMFDVTNTHFNTTNLNTAGVYTSWSNT